MTSIAAVKNPTDPASTSTATAATAGDIPNGSAASLAPPIQYTSSSTMGNSPNTPTTTTTSTSLGNHFTNGGGTIPKSSPSGSLTPSGALISTYHTPSTMNHPVSTNNITATTGMNDPHQNGGAILDPMINYLDYEVFDPLNWMLDGFVDFPSSLNGGRLSPPPPSASLSVPIPPPSLPSSSSLPPGSSAIAPPSTGLPALPFSAAAPTGALPAVAAPPAV